MQKFKVFLSNFLNHKSETVFSAGLLMSFLTFLGSLLGIIRNALLASRFGASTSLDIYYASFRLPDFIYNTFVLGAISVAFIPLFNEYLTKDKESAWRFTNFIMIFTGIFLGFFSILLIIFARPLLTKILIGFDQNDLNLVIILTKIMMIQPLLLGISSIVSGLLRSFRLFFITTLSPLMYNLGIIIGILFFVPLWGLKGLAFGVVLGAFLHLFIQIPSLKKIDYHFRFPLRNELLLFSAGFKKLIKIMSSRSSSIIIYQLFLIGITSISTSLKEGSLAILNFVDSILPYTTFALPFADAAFPQLSKLDAEQNQADFSKVFWNTFNYILFFIIPLAVWFIVFREPIVRLLLGYGKFNWEATITTMQVLAYLSVGMIFQSINYYLLKVFFAKKEAVKPFFASLIAYTTGFFLSYKLAEKFNILGLVEGIILTYILYSILLFYFLRHDINYFFDALKEMYKKLFKIIIAAIFSGLVGYLTLELMSHFLSLNKVIYLIIDSGIAAFLTLISFLVLANYFKLQTLQEFKLIISKKFLLKRNNEKHS